MTPGAWDQSGILSQSQRLPERRPGGWARLQTCPDLCAPVLPLSGRDEGERLLLPIFQVSKQSVCALAPDLTVTEEAGPDSVGVGGARRGEGRLSSSSAPFCHPGEDLCPAAP